MQGTYVEEIGREFELRDHFREHLREVWKKMTKKFQNQLRAISTSRTTPTTTWQSVVFPYTKETQKAVKASTKI